MDEKMTPAQKNRYWARQNYSGSLGIFTIVSGWYQWYLPMFFDRIAKELPAAMPIVFVRGAIEIPEPWRSKCRSSAELEEYSNDGYTTAALRYVFSNPEIEDFDYLHITDSDMLLMSEPISMINQHMRHCMSQGLECYDNHVSSISMGAPKCPGVHFITKDWWKRTAAARQKFSDILRKNGSSSWEWDEIMLAEIIKTSGLQLCDEPVLWAHHGIHLGDWRRRLRSGFFTPQITAQMQLYIRKLIADVEFMKIIDLCKQHVDMLSETFEEFKKI